MKYFLTFCLTIIFWGAFSQQQPLVITVKDKHSFEPLPGATIAIMPGNLNIVADKEGRARAFLPLPASDSSTPLRATVSVMGYITDTILLKEGQKMEILLASRSGLLEEVAVTGAMRAVKRSASPVPVELYTPKFFLKNPSPSIFESLQMVNGVRPQLNCNVCNTGDIHINGLEGPYTMVLIDGMPIVSNLASVYGLSGIPTSLIERVEVVKGPASSLYGSEAIGGLINVITKLPEKSPLVSVDVSATSWQEYNTDLGIKYRTGKRSTALLGVNYFNYEHPVDKNKDHFTDITLQDRVSVFNKISWKRKEDRLASLAVRYVYEDRWGGEMNWNKSFRGGDSVYGESIYTSRTELIGNYALPVREKLEFAYSLNRHDQHSVYGTTLFNARQDVAFGRLTWEKKLPDRHVLLLGAVGRYTYYDDNTPATFDPATGRSKPDKIMLPGIFIQDELSINEKQELLTGIRYDYDKRHGHIFTPRAAYKLSATPDDIIRINAGSGFRVVNIFTEDHAALTGAREVVIEDKLEPERSYNVNLNYFKRMHTASYWMTLDFSAWFAYFTNRIIPDYTSNTNQIRYHNLDGYAISKGVSLNMESGFVNSLKITSGITVMDVGIADGRGNTPKRIERQLLTERWMANWTIAYTLPRLRLTLDYTGNVYGPMLLPLLSELDPRDPRSPVWSIQNIQLTQKLSSSVEIYGGIKNLLNWTPAKHAAFIIARSDDPFDKRVQFDADGQALSTPDNPYALTFDPNYVYAPNQGIRGFIGLRYKAGK